MRRLYGYANDPSCIYDLHGVDQGIVGSGVGIEKLSRRRFDTCPESWSALLTQLQATGTGDFSFTLDFQFTATNTNQAQNYPFQDTNGQNKFVGSYKDITDDFIAFGVRLFTAGSQVIVVPAADGMKRHVLKVTRVSGLVTVTVDGVTKISSSAEQYEMNATNIPNVPFSKFPGCIYEISYINANGTWKPSDKNLWTDFSVVPKEPETVPREFTKGATTELASLAGIWKKVGTNDFELHLDFSVSGSVADCHVIKSNTANTDVLLNAYLYSSSAMTFAYQVSNKGRQTPSTGSIPSFSISGDHSLVLKRVQGTTTLTLDGVTISNVSGTQNLDLSNTYSQVTTFTGKFYRIFLVDTNTQIVYNVDQNEISYTPNWFSKAGLVKYGDWRNFSVSPVTWSLLTAKLQAVGSGDFEFSITYSQNNPVTSKRWFGPTSTENQSFFMIGYNYSETTGIISVRLSSDSSDDVNVALTGQSLTGKHTALLKVVGYQIDIYFDGTLKATKTISEGNRIALDSTSITNSYISNHDGNIYDLRLTTNSETWIPGFVNLYTSYNSIAENGVFTGRNKTLLSYVETPLNFSGYAGDFTIIARMFIASDGTLDIERHWVCDNGFQTNNMAPLAISNVKTSTSYNSNFIVKHTDGVTGGLYLSTATYPVAVNGWNTFVMVGNRTTNTLQAFVNGIGASRTFASTAPLYNNSNDSIITWTKNLVIGTANVNLWNNPSNDKVSDFLVYDRALAEPEIKAIINMIGG